MVAVAAGRRATAAGGGSRRRAGCGEQSQAQQRLMAVAVAARFAEAGAVRSADGSAGAGGCCVELLECLLGALGVSVTAVAPAPAQYKWAVRSIRRRGRPRGASAEGRRAGVAEPPASPAPPGRIAGNGASASAAASLYTMQGKKGVNQDAMVVWEVTSHNHHFLLRSE
jgi:hypothetical protein